MKLKNILIIGVAGILSISLSGCSDSFLEVENPSSDDLKEYFSNDAHIKEALVAVYDPLHWPDWNGAYNPLNIVSDILADQINVGGGSSSDMMNWQLLSNYNGNSNQTLSGLWTAEYSGVKRANDLISYIDALNLENTDITEANAIYYKTQARVLRAYYYLNLWKFWGYIVYYTENLTGNYLGEQYEPSEIYEKVITDLEDAINLNVLPMRELEARAGYVTKAFAEMIYADFVLYQKDSSRYSKALNYMKDIINSGKYDLNPNYAAIWTESGEWGVESIYEVNYNDDNHQRGWSNTMAVGGTVLPRLIGPRGWTSGVDGVDNGWSFAPVRQETYDMYSAVDTRRDATCYNADAVAAANGIEYEHAWQHTGFFLNKYLPRVENVKDAGWDQDLNFNNNLRVYRFAETLLNAAELLVLTGGDNGEAARYVSRVRLRAGLGDVSTTTQDNILEERRLEFVGEGKRYFDLVRTGKAASVLVAGSVANRTNNWSEDRKYVPIEQGELSADPNLKQVPGYK
jgi:hypothetical protein